MTPDARKAEPEAGNVFIFQTDIEGIADPRFQSLLRQE
jgi:hypothetical protein